MPNIRAPDLAGGNYCYYEEDEYDLRYDITKAAIFFIFLVCVSEKMEIETRQGILLVVAIFKI